MVVGAEHLFPISPVSMWEASIRSAPGLFLHPLEGENFSKIIFEEELDTYGPDLYLQRMCPALPYARSSL